MKWQKMNVLFCETRGLLSSRLRNMHEPAGYSILWCAFCWSNAETTITDKGINSSCILMKPLQSSEANNENTQLEINAILRWDSRQDWSVFQFFRQCLLFFSLLSVCFFNTHTQKNTHILVQYNCVSGENRSILTTKRIENRFNNIASESKA